MGSNHSIVKPVVLFDGVCNLCNSSVSFIIKRDKKNKFLFASLQSEYAKKHLDDELSNGDNLQSLVLKDGNKTLIKSSAVLTIAKGLSGLWPLAYGFMIIPGFIRNAVYDLIAKNRYRWFGKRNQCMIPSPELKSKFLD